MPDDKHDRASGDHTGAHDEDSESVEKLPSEANPDDETPFGDTDQHSDVPSEGPTR